jgi:two-component system phosphate regulon sensor histidine kinase PhoR
MDGALSRILKGLLLVAVCSLVGLVAARVSSSASWAPLLGAAIGTGAAVVLIMLHDARRAERLMAWLRSEQVAGAPREGGFWGELSYRTEKALRTREQHIGLERDRLQQFLSAIEASPNGVMLLDANDQIDWCNSVAAEHFGLDPQRDRLQRVTNLVRTPAFVAYLQAAEFGEPVVFAGPSGRSTLSVLVRPYGDGMKLVLSQDITERERNEAMRRDFVANVSHEIRTPLTVVAGFIETLVGLPLTETEKQRVLTLMGQQTDRMQTLVGDLLTLAQLEGSPRPAPDQWVGLYSLLGRALTDAQALSLSRHQMSLHAPLDVEVAGSEHELFSAVSNLLTNAVRYTPAGGQITLHWQARQDGGGDIEVVDSGIGIAREHLPRLTERFYRVDGSRSRDTGGTGLGLSIVKHVVQRHGGEVEIQSDLGKGSTFRLRLPAVRVRRVAAKDETAGLVRGETV